MGTLVIRLVAVFLLALSAPAWSAPPDLGAAPGSCCGETCPAGDEGSPSECASCCAFTLWVGRSPSTPATPERVAPTPTACRLFSQGVVFLIERPPARA